jgi:hypothetical protein
MYSESDPPNKRKEKVYCRILPILEFKKNDDLYIFGSVDGDYKMPGIPRLIAIADIDELLSMGKDSKLEWEEDPDTLIKDSLKEKIPGINVVGWKEDARTPLTYNEDEHCWNFDILIKVLYEGELPDEFEPGKEPIPAEPFYENIELLRAKKKPWKRIKTML